MDVSARAGLWLFGPAVAWLVLAGVGLGRSAADDTRWADVPRVFGEVAGSDDCRRCHPAQYESWYRTYHRTMTQRVDDPDAMILAPFAGEQFEYAGFVATMDRNEEGAPHVTIVSSDDGTVVLDADVELSVGSHRYQQYVARLPRGGGPLERWRLPVAWHPEAGRWIHLNGAFLEPEAPVGDREGYLRHLSRWNDNCLFCHNTEPVPGLDDHGRFDTELGEVGIACEACHGAGAAHVARHADPFRRLLATGEGDGSITHPDRLDAGRSTDLCGRCHGQRIAHDIGRVLREGDGFVPGDPLGDVSRPIQADSEVHGLPPRPFAERFWADGTPRLSAYEYQALIASPCHQDGEGLGCNDCHDMHGSDPDGQVAPGGDGPTACTGCHAPTRLSQAKAPGGHGRHGEAAPQVDCLDCHMPKITYGLLLGMRTHRIAADDLQAPSDEARPDACTQCHTDRDRPWASATVRAWTEGAAPTLARTSEVPRLAREVVGGDPVQRALACASLADPDAVGDPWTRAAWLAEAVDDGFPAIRFMAWRGLSRGLEDDGWLLAATRPKTAEPLRTALARFDPFGPAEDRIEAAAQVRALVEPQPHAAAITPARLGPDWLDDQRADADTAQIWIGE